MQVLENADRVEVAEEDKSNLKEMCRKWDTWLEYRNKYEFNPCYKYQPFQDDSAI